MKRFICIRHGESEKNLKDIYGGKGDILTDDGIEQIKNACFKIKQVINEDEIKPKIYISVKRLHIIETAQIIQNEVDHSGTFISSKYKPVRLGIIDGMPKERQRELYPDAVAALEKWNEGKGDIKDFYVEGLQPADEYFDQIKDFLEELPDNEIYILVGTRSDMSALKNVILENDPKSHMGYKYYESDYAEIFVADLDEKGKFKIVSGIEKAKVKKGDDFDEIV